MKLCGKPVPKSKNGTDRGLCTRPLKHMGAHTSGLCIICGVNLIPAGRCRECKNEYHRDLSRISRGSQPRNRQEPCAAHRFPCGCSGVLPRHGERNMFAVSTGSVFICRILAILNMSQHAAKRGGHKPIPKPIPHAVIRKMMDDPNCERCGQPLVWEFGMGKTPHLHHNHETGEPLGFTHPVCNPQAMENEIDRLKALLKKNGLSHD